MILGLLTLLSTLAWGAEPGQAEDAAVQHAMDQAKLFTRRGWVEDARAELEAAAATPAGAESAALWWALAGARLSLCDAEGAWLAAERAAALTKDEAARAEALTFAADLRGQQRRAGHRNYHQPHRRDEDAGRDVIEIDVFALKDRDQHGQRQAEQQGHPDPPCKQCQRLVPAEGTQLSGQHQQYHHT